MILPLNISFQGLNLNILIPKPNQTQQKKLQIKVRRSTKEKNIRHISM